MAKLKEQKKGFTDADIVQMLSVGMTGYQIAEKTKINIRTLEARLTRIRDKSNSTNVAHLVGNYFRNKLIK